MRNKSKQQIMLLIFCLLLSFLAGCSSTDTNGDDITEPDQTASAPLERKTAIGLMTIASYEEVYSLISENRSSVHTQYEDAEGTRAEADTGNAALNDATDSAAAPSASDQHSLTNTQVAGIDEADLVKTDGQYLYMLSESKLVIAKADGGETTVISNTDIAASNYEDTSGKSEYAQNMYISGDTLVILTSVDEWWEATSEEDTGYKSYTNANIYDISNPASPALVTQLGQDGYLSGSRLVDGILYMVSNYSIYELNEEDIGTYIPSTYLRGEAECIAVNDICIPINTTESAWTVLSAIDVEDGSRLSSRSVLGGTATVYMNAENLYVACSNWHCDEGESYTEVPYQVTEYLEYSTTDIMSFSYDNGALALENTGMIPGTLINQFAMDAYNGNLRAVTTDNYHNYKIYTDEAHGWSNYEEIESGSSAGLYVLSESLKVVGKADHLAEGERVYSVRFDGDIGYFVTYLEVDPLFAVDLSTPSDPKVLSALKIPGFSQYLHLYGDGRLFGLGMTVNEEENWTENVKLSMFDISDPANVSEKNTLILEATGSSALYDHHAIMVDSEKNILAFPVDNGYKIYGYSDADGFYERTSIPIDTWTYNLRGLYIGDFFYICSTEYIGILNLNDLSLVTELNMTQG